MISYKKKLLFIHRGKSGGNSISKVLSGECSDLCLEIKHKHQDGIDRFEPVSLGLEIPKHAGLNQYLKKDPSIQLNDFYKFVVIRNPYSRLISAYFSPHRLINLGTDEFVRSEFIKLIENQKTFRDFVCLSNSDQLDTNMDRILKFENLSDDFNLMAKALGFTQTLPSLNKGANRDYRDYYDDEIIDLVETKFSEELKFFNYQF